MVDDYGGYKVLFSNGVTELGCWARMRAGNSLTSLLPEDTLWPNRRSIARLYAIEADTQEMDCAAPARHCAEHSQPELTALNQWLTGLRPTVADGAP